MTPLDDAIFYHIYPLGLCGGPRVNLPGAPLQQGWERIVPWLDQAVELGAGAVLLGPVLESETHGYDVADYFHADRRLGGDAGMERLAAEVHARGLRLILDGVFHHVGRNFWAFRDVLAQGRSSRFCDWFHLDFSRNSPLGDPFGYQGWNGCHDLVKLNVAHPEVRGHLWEAVREWLQRWGIDGLRLDAADSLDRGFQRDLADHCRSLRSDLWLLAEVIHGDYRAWLLEAGLDSVTNYELYKGLHSSFNEENFFEIAHSLRRQFASYGLYRGRALYTFADNHDVERVASTLKDPALLFPLYCLLFTMPGTPSIYYGSEFAVTGRKGGSDDWALRPALDLEGLRRHPPTPDLAQAISRLSRLRAALPALQHGDYTELGVEHRRLAFLRTCGEQRVVVAVSALDQPTAWELPLPGLQNGVLRDRLDPGQEWRVRRGRVRLDPLWPRWARVLELGES